LRGLEHFGDLFNAIIYKQVLTIKYQSFKNPEPEISFIHPYYLKQYNNRWFLFGYNPAPKVNALSNRALDRIIEIKVDDKTEFIENTKYDFFEYFEDMIGVTKPVDIEVQRIKLWFSPDQAPYIDSKPLHGTQKCLSWDDSGMIITIEVIPNIELEQLILRHGEHCMVLEPTKVKDRIKKKLCIGFRNYS
jgi:predicted DNA-binding transcriptional regulator YafY